MLLIGRCRVRGRLLIVINQQAVLTYRQTAIANRISTNFIEIGNAPKDTDKYKTMDVDEGRKVLNLSPLALEHLRKDLLATVYTQTGMKLTVYQRAQLINATRFVTKKPQKNAKINAQKGRRRRSSNSDSDASLLPDERVLNELQLDRELEALSGVYAVALEQLRNTSQQMLDCLSAAVTARSADRNEVEQAEKTLAASEATLKALQAQIADERLAAEERLRRGDERTATLRQNLRNSRLLNELEVRLVQQWEENRYTQACIVGENEERALRQQTAELKRRIDGERRIMREVDAFSALQFEELRSKIAAWQQKYATEMGAQQAQTQAHEQRLAELQKSLERHRETYAARVKFVEDYLAQKEVERQLYEQEMHRVHCAVQIQAWWRGVMVRRGLGPFKKKSKGKGKKGKGAKGGK